MPTRESLGPPTPTAAPRSAAASSTTSVAAPPNVDAIANAVDDLKVASDYDHDAAKTLADLHAYGGQAATALHAGQQAVQATIPSSDSNELRSDMQQLQQILAKIAPDVQVATAPHTAPMVLASRLDLLPLALELARLNGETGSMSGTVHDTAGNPVAQAFVTIAVGEAHPGLMTDANGNFKTCGGGAFRAVEVKAYPAGQLYLASSVVQQRVTVP
jgi:hypothetical protein